MNNLDTSDSTNNNNNNNQFINSFKKLSFKNKLFFTSFFQSYLSESYLIKNIMTSCCACCCFYPKYKRKVDNIYPRNLDQPLIKNEVDKLQYYVTVHPEKLSKIGDYLYQNLKWGLNGTYRNRNYVKNTIEAVEKILNVITPQNLNYYAPNYLKIIQKLLEQGGSGGAGGQAPINSNSNNGITNTNSNGTLNVPNNDSLEYQKQAAVLFQKFCEKEASNSSTVNYNLNFDQFVGQFSAMCYKDNKDERMRAEIRSSGLQCLATMVRRLVPEDNLRASYIWDNMDRIIPALLYIMHENFLNTRSADMYNDVEDEVIENELGPYLYGDFYLNSKLKHSIDDVNLETSNNNNNKDVNLDNIKIQFRKASTQLNQSNNSTNNNNNTNKSGQNSPEEGNVMINLNDNRVNQNQPQVIDPDHEAKMLLKNISSKADYTTIGKIVIPILTFLDDNRPNSWKLSKFVRCIFFILMYNVKQQHAIVIKELIKHLDSHRNSDAQLKCYIIRIIIVCIRIAAMQSVGTAGQIIDIFTNLLRHLNHSVEKSCNYKQQLINRNVSSADTSRYKSDLDEENKLQREIISAMGQFTSNLPDYAKNDVFMFIARQINSQQFTYWDVAPGQNTNSEQLNQQIRSKYFECLHEICTKYKPTQLFSAFTSGQFLDDILKLTLVNDYASRRRAHEILHQLLDKYQLLSKIKQLKPNLFFEPNSGSGNIVSVKKDFSKSTSTNILYKTNENESNLSLNRLSSITPSSNQKQKISYNSLANLKMTRNQTYLSQLDLNDSRVIITSKEDVIFMRKNGRAFLSHINENLFIANNRRENYESIYITICLFLIGLFNEKEFLIDLIRFGFHVQELALLNHEQQGFTFALQCNIHKFVCAYFLLLSKSSNVPDFYRYCSEICDLRRRKDLFKFVYPEYILLDSVSLGSDSGIQSTTASTSLTEIETEFKRDLTSSCKEYSKYVQELSSVKETIKSRSNQGLNENEIEQESSNLSQSKKSLVFNSSSNFNISKPKMAGWLFDKNAIEEILRKSNFSTSNLYNFDSEFSLSVSYLQQSVLSLQSVLRFRSPYSNSYESVATFNNQPELINDPPRGDGPAHPQRGHNRGASGFGISPSMNQITPRRSIDAESNIDDDTTYDSTSQISLDQNGYDLDPNNQQYFYIDPNNDNQATVNSLSVIKSHYDITSFETIKRVLFNGGTNVTGSNLSNSGIGAGAASTIGPASSIPGTLIAGASPLLTLNQQNGDSIDDNEEQNSKIISEFKQKPFDELKQNLLKTNQNLINSEKYQQVFEQITKDMTSINNHQSSGYNSTSLNSTENGFSSAQTNGGAITTHYQEHNSSINKANLSASSISTAASTQSNLNSNGIISKDNNNQSKSVPLNDIDFPQLFMY